MKLTTAAIAFGPAVLTLAAKFALDPAWLKEWSVLACLALGVAIGAFGVVSASIVEQDY